MYRRGQASAVGAVFLTLIVILLAALIARQIQVQTEVQKIASEVATQRSGEGQLSLTLNYTFLSFSPGNVSDGTRSCIPSLTSATCIFPSNTDNGKYMLTLYFSAVNVPNYFYNVTSNLYLSSNETVEATLYENNNGTLIARGTYTLPANSPIVIISHFVNYTIIFSSISPFKISIDFFNYTFQAYNSTGFYAKITNIGPSPTRLYGLWLLSSTYATRINTSTWLEPGASQTFSANLPVSSILEIRAVTTTRINIFEINVRPPAYTGAPGSGGATYPHFTIYSYNSSIVGTPSSSKKLVVGIVNDGGASGVAVVRVLDSSGNVASLASVSLSPGQRTDVSLSVVLPPASGNYQWRIVAINSATGNQDDAKTVLVQVVTYTPVFYIASYTGNITGAVSSRQLFNVTVTNSGNATGTVRVRVLDQAGNTVNSTVLAVSPGASVATSLALTLPSSSGTYSWTVQAVDNATGTIHDSKPITVRAVVYQPKFSIQSYNTSITGAAGSKQKIVVTVANTGNATGAVQVSIIDNNGNTVNSTTLSIPAGQTATATLTVTLPSSRGTYTWKINVTNQATGKIDDTKTLLVTAKDIYLQSRGAVSFSSFDTLPSWTQDPTGSWSVSGGVLTGTDKSQAGKAGSIIYNASYTTSGSLYLLVATQLSTTGHVHWGFILARDTSNWIFAGIYTDTNSYYLEACQVQNDKISGTASRGGSFTASGWATLFAVYTPTSGGSSFTIQLYTAGGNFSYTASLGSSSLYPGLTVNDDDRKQYSRVFDNFIASTSDPRIVTVTGLQQGWIVELYDQTGNLIARATADTSGKATLGVLASPITTNGKIVIKDASGNAIIQKTFTQIVGGDTYSYG
ncbi:MAG: hypothetical protein LM573_01815 [Thermofilum sp.]|nr:hypothetical protein [Thermofilum sp.]